MLILGELGPHNWRSRQTEHAGVGVYISNNERRLRQTYHVEHGAARRPINVHRDDCALCNVRQWTRQQRIAFNGQFTLRSLLLKKIHYYKLNQMNAVSALIAKHGNFTQHYDISPSVSETEINIYSFVKP